MGLIKGTHHVALKCNGAEQFKETVNFYQNVLGLELVRDWGEGDDAGAMVSTGNSIIEIFAAGAVSGETGSVNHYALATDDVDKCVEVVKAAGYKVTVQPDDMVIPANQGDYALRMAFVIGPVGEEIEFFTEK